MENYRVVSVRGALGRGDQTYADNLEDFHFELHSSTKRVLAIVTLSVTGSQEFVSISPFVMNIHQSNSQNNLGSYWISETVSKRTDTSITN